MEQKRKQKAGWRAWARRRWERAQAAIYGCDAPGKPRQKIGHRIYCYVRRISEAYATHQCSLLACACAYCALLSLVPLLVVGIAGIGFFVGGSETALNQVVTAIRGYVPINPDFLKDILNHILHDRGFIGLFGIVGLLYGAHQTFLAMEPAMNVIWGVPETRHWLQQRLIALGATLLTIVLLGANLAVTWLLAYVQSVDIPLLRTHLAAFFYSFGIGLVPVLLMTLLCALLYQILPARTIPWQPAFLGAGVAAVFWELTKYGFGIFLVYVHSYDRLYGSLSSLVVLVVWSYYTMAILLLGAEITADLAFLRYGARAAEARAHTSPDLATARGIPHVHADSPLDHDAGAR